MRVNTIWSGILSTNLSSVESTSKLTRMLVPNPKKAFQSPGVHSFGLLSVVIALPLRQDGHTVRVRAHASGLFRSVFENVCRDALSGERKHHYALIYPHGVRVDLRQ